MEFAEEVIGNIHMHTRYSDGAGSHDDIARAAMAAGLDFVVVTDHNVWVAGAEGYYEQTEAAKRERVLVLIGQEVHDMRRDPQVNHCLVIGAEQEVALYAPNPQKLIDKVAEVGGYTFLAHPHDPPAPYIKEESYHWVDWDIQGFTGLELWNYMSSFKFPLTGLVPTVRAILHPEKYITAPPAATLRKWDELLTAGQKVSVVGGSDGHALTYHAGPISRVIFPYEQMFRAVNTHLLLERPLKQDFAQDKAAVVEAIGHGRGWVGYDGIAPTKGFRFSAHGRGKAVMGQTVRMDAGTTIQAVVPLKAHLKLIHQGKIVAEAKNDLSLAYIAFDPGAYRLEAWLTMGKQTYGWIFSNPIYLIP
jgi:hypothetical protein